MKQERNGVLPWGQILGVEWGWTPNGKAIAGFVSSALLSVTLPHHLRPLHAPHARVPA